MHSRSMQISIINFRNLLVCSYALILPFCEWFTVRMNNILLIILCALAVIEFIRAPKSFRPLIHPAFFLTAGVFLAQSIDLFHFDEIDAIGKNWLLKLPFLLFPIALFPFKPDQRIQNRIENAFIIGCLFACLLTFRFMFNPAYKSVNLLNYSEYETFLVLQRPYFGMYLLLAICFLFKHGKQCLSLLNLFLALFFILFIWLIQAKMALFTLLILVIMECRKITRPPIQKWISGLVISGFLMLLIILSVFYLKHYKNPNQLSGNKRFFILSVNTRIDHTTCAFEIIRSNPILGVGKGKLAGILDRCYEENKFEFTKYGRHYNIHNEWLEETARHGIIGLFIYILCFIFFFRQAKNTGNQLYLQFLIIVVLLALTETLFSRAQGVLMIAFFNTLFILPSVKRD